MGHCKGQEFGLKHFEFNRTFSIQSGGNAQVARYMGLQLRGRDLSLSIRLGVTSPEMTPGARG